MLPSPRHSPSVDAQLQDAIGRIGQLPVLDRALRRVRELAGDPESDTNELVSALETDPGLAANVLRFANSAACARPVRAQTVRQAVTLVGRVSVGRLALEAAVCRFFELAPGTGGASRGLLHVHASQVAAVAGALAERAGADAEAAHLAGLLHDLGKLVMPLAFGEEALDAVAREHAIGAGRALLERERFGVDHAYAGEVFAREAFLEARVFNAIGAHHGDGVPSPEAACVQAANAAVHLVHDLHADADVLNAALAQLSLDPTVLDDVVPLALPSLAPTVTGLAGRIAALERAATTDDVTGLLTRTAWMNAMREQLQRGTVRHRPRGRHRRPGGARRAPRLRLGEPRALRARADPRTPRNRRSSGRRRAGALGHRSPPPRPTRSPRRCATTSIPASAPTA